jgi:hypothetical protein
VPLPAGVTLQPDVVMVHGGASVLKGLSSDHGIWTIDKNADGASGLSVGKVLLIAGVDCARVTALADNGDGTLDVTIAPVAFTDVIQEGSFDWQSASVDLSQAILGQAPYSFELAGDASDAGADDASADDGGAGCADSEADGGPPCMSPGARRGRAQNPHLDPIGKTATPNSVSLTIGNWMVQFAGGFANNTLSLQATGAWSPFGSSTNASGPKDTAQTLGGIATNVTLSATINNVRTTSGSLNISGGTITSANMTTDISGSVKLGAQMSTMMGSQYPAQALLKIPLTIEVPLYWGPIPFYSSYSMAFLIQPSLATKDSVLGIGGQVSFSGNAGVTFSSGTASPAAAPSLTAPENPITTATAPPEIGAMAVVFSAQLPRVGFGIGSTAFAYGASAGLFIDAVTSLGLVVGPATELVPCESADWQTVVHGGGEMNIKVPGATVTISHQIDLTNSPERTWYSPMTPACKP